MTGHRTELAELSAVTPHSADSRGATPTGARRRMAFSRAPGAAT